jgi:hypothetical protein
MAADLQRPQPRRQDKDEQQPEPDLPAQRPPVVLRRLVAVQVLNGTPFTQETHRPAKGMVGHVTGAPAEPLPALLEPR